MVSRAGRTRLELRQLQKFNPLITETIPLPPMLSYRVPLPPFSEPWHTAVERGQTRGTFSLPRPETIAAAVFSLSPSAPSIQRALSMVVAAYFPPPFLPPFCGSPCPLLVGLLQPFGCLRDFCTDPLSDDWFPGWAPTASPPFCLPPPPPLVGASARPALFNIL